MYASGKLFDEAQRLMQVADRCRCSNLDAMEHTRTSLMNTHGAFLEFHNHMSKAHAIIQRCYFSAHMDPCSPPATDYVRGDSSQ
eukprot:1281391-Pleurochrysis_carterae.AAC.1